MNKTRDDRWIQTYSGRAFWPLDPDPDHVDIVDIAHSLACNNRFNGHTFEPYNVAQHSLLVSYYCDPADALHGLLHDASEAYLHDIVRPIKNSVQIDGRPYAEYEDRLTEIIFQKYGIDLPMPESVKRADNVLLVSEKRDLMAECERIWHHYDALPLDVLLEPLPWRSSKELFLARFAGLIGKPQEPAR